MGRQYKGLDYSKVTVKLDDELHSIVGRYSRDHGGSARVSDAMRAAVRLLGAYMEMSDLMETSCANLMDIAAVFDKVDGPNTRVYAEAIRQAAGLMWMFHYDAKKDGR